MLVASIFFFSHNVFKRFWNFFKVVKSRDCMVTSLVLTTHLLLNAVFNSISVISRPPVHLSMLSWRSFNQYSAQYALQGTGCFPHKTIVETTDSGERGILRQSSILGKNIGQAGNRTSDLLFSSPQHYRLSYGAGLLPHNPVF